MLRYVSNKWTVPDGPGIKFFSAVRMGDYKLIYDMKKAKLELYNLKEDIGEQHDLAATMPRKVKELTQVLSDQLRKYDAQLPTYRNDGQTIPYPDHLRV